MIDSPIFEIRDLVVEFDTARGVLRAVDGVNLALARGEVLGLVGESGSGKSVTVMAAMRLIRSRNCRVVAGEVVLNGVDLLQASARELRRVRGLDISMVFQDPMTSLNPVLTVGSQIAETIRAHQNVSHRAARHRAVDLLGEVGVPNPLQRQREYPHQYSGGMRQRVMIAMALANRPSVLIADEPTTALDATIQAQILDLLRHVRETHQVGVVLITHDLRLIAELADRVAVMYGGRIVEVGSVRQIFSNPAHPYTAGLLASLPRLGDRRTDLPSIPGEPIDVFAPPPGCAFHPRCPLAEAVCSVEDPPFRATDGGRHGAACHFSDRVGMLMEDLS